MNRLLILSASFLIFVLSCKKEESSIPNKSSENNLFSFAFLKEKNSLDQDYIGEIVESNIKILIPYGTDTKSLIATFSTSNKAKVKVNNVEVISGVTQFDYSLVQTLAVEAENGTIKNYTVSLIFGKWVEFQYIPVKTAPNGVNEDWISSISLIGSFNDWAENKNIMILGQDGVFRCRVLLEGTQIDYRYVLKGSVTNRMEIKDMRSVSGRSYPSISSFVKFGQETIGNYSFEYYNARIELNSLHYYPLWNVNLQLSNSKFEFYGSSSDSSVVIPMLNLYVNEKLPKILEVMGVNENELSLPIKCFLYPGINKFNRYVLNDNQANNWIIGFVTNSAFPDFGLPSQLLIHCVSPSNFATWSGRTTPFREYTVNLIHELIHRVHMSQANSNNSLLLEGAAVYFSGVATDYVLYPTATQIQQCINSSLYNGTIPSFDAIMGQDVYLLGGTIFEFLYETKPEYRQDIKILINNGLDYNLTSFKNKEALENAWKIWLKTKYNLAK